MSKNNIELQNAINVKSEQYQEQSSKSQREVGILGYYRLSGTDQISELAGNDLIEGKTCADTIDGGNGTDTAQICVTSALKI